MSRSVFESVKIAGIPCANRIIRSGTHEGLADENGMPTDALRNLYVRLAKGDVGAIITGFCGVMQNGKSSFKGMSMIDTDDHISAYRSITDSVHRYNTPIILQLVHCGRQTRSAVTGSHTVAPSEIRDKFFNEEIPEALTESEIQTVIDQFVKGIVRAKKAGFDGVQLHAAHGYLLSQFLSSYTNHRTDRWGGSVDNKFRIIREIFKRASEQVGTYPIWVKINAYDDRRNGMRLGEAIEIAKLLEQVGCAAIEVSCGVFEDGLLTVRGESLPLDAVMKHTFKYRDLPTLTKMILGPMVRTVAKPPEPIYNYNLQEASQIKSMVNIPVIVVGGINNIVDIEEMIESEQTDFVAMSRPFIIEPDIVQKFCEGLQTESRCLMCNYCTVIAETDSLKCHYETLS